VRRRAPAANRTWPLYAGGFLGPFGGAMVSPMLPELRDGLHTTLTVAAGSLSAYLIPFSAVMLVSGTLAERWGRRRTVRVAYLGYAVGSAACALAGGTAAFMAGRAVQGTANAFTTPVLVASISDLVPEHRLGRALGRYGSMQSAGVAFAPFVGGLAAAVQWRLAFVASVLAAGALAALPPPDAVPSPSDHRSAGWRSLRNSRLGLACSLGFLFYFGWLGTTVLVALIAADRFGLGPDARGLVVAVFGLAGLTGGAWLGRGLDLMGARIFGIAGGLALGVTSMLLGITGNLAVLVALVAASGAASIASRVTVNSLAVRSTPGNRSGATSMMLAWQFLGGAVAPVALLPVYGTHAGLALIGAGCATIAAACVLAGAPSRLLPVQPSPG
jgi:MFS family permease